MDMTFGIWVSLLSRNQTHDVFCRRSRSARRTKKRGGDLSLDIKLIPKQCQKLSRAPIVF